MNKILASFYKKLDHTPKKTVLLTSEKAYSVQDIHYFSNYIAKRIIEDGSQYVPFYLKNDTYVLPTILAIYKRGKIPVPLNTSLSFEVALEQICDLKFSSIVTDEKQYDRQACFLETFDTEENELTDQATHRHSEVAYLIMTSGTTGRPKKIQLTEDNIISILLDYYNLVALGSGSKMIFATPPSFDVSISEIFAPILTEAELLCFDEIYDSHSIKAKALLEKLSDEQVTHLFASPSYLQLLLDISSPKHWKSLQAISAAGELFTYHLKETLKKYIKPYTKVFNLYGPAETTLFATAYQLTFTEKEFVPIGSPLKGVKIKEVSRNDREKELYIGGVGLSKGYTDRTLTQEAYTMIDGKRFYKTGDFVFHQHGELIFSRRKDQQVKINGIRIEPSGIDQMLLAQPEVKNCRTIVDRGRLYAFIQLYSRSEQSAILAYIDQNIPKNYGLRVRFVKQFILTSNRKLDVRAMVKNTEDTLRSSENLEELSRTIDQLLQSFGAQQLSELDSLDLLRFYLAVEEKYCLSIPSERYANLRNKDELLRYLQAKPKQTSVRWHTEDKKWHLKNIRQLISLPQQKIGSYFPSLYLQKNYLDKNYRTIMFRDIHLTAKQMESLPSIFDEFLRQLDIFSLRLNCVQGDILFEQAECFQTKFYYSKQLLPAKAVSNIMNEQIFNRLSFVNIATDQQIARLYLSHMIIDEFRMNRLLHLLADKLQNKELVLPRSSYLSYIQTIRQKSHAFNALERWLPVTPYQLTYHSAKPSWYLRISGDLFQQQSSQYYSNVATFCYFKLLAKYHHISQVTGTMIANIPLDIETETCCTFGDMHSTFLFSLDTRDDFSAFEEKNNRMIQLYAQGISLREKIFENYPHFRKQDQCLKESWEAMNLSVNFIGEVVDPWQKLKQLKKDHYSQKYLVAFRHQNHLYVYLGGNIFTKERNLDLENWQVEVLPLEGGQLRCISLF